MPRVGFESKTLICTRTAEGNTSYRLTYNCGQARSGRSANSLTNQIIIIIQFNSIYLHANLTAKGQLQREHVKKYKNETHSNKAKILQLILSKFK
jgi:hypothetical protein